MDTTWSDIPAGVDPRTLLCPEAFGALDRLEHAVWHAGVGPLAELARRRTAMLLGASAELDRRPTGAPEPTPDQVAQLAAWPTSPAFSDTERAALAFTEQFVIDVSGITDDDRARLGGQLAPEQMGAFVLSLYALDYTMRVRLALGRLFPEAGPIPADRPVPAGAGVDLGLEFDRMIKTIALLDSLDPVTTELVRLRGARTHNCRICQSTRSVAALEAGADESTFDRIDRYETSDFDERTKTALRLTDALVTQPGAMTDELVAGVRRHFSPAQAAEIVLDVARNSAQKSAVALAVDQAHVTEGVELYSIAADGDVVFYGDRQFVA
jgi:alkylhydroperoxidase family enzyme